MGALQMLWVAFVALATISCGASAPARFYTLNSTVTRTNVPPAGYSVLVGPVSVPAAVDRPQFVIQVTPNRVEVDEFNRWVAPLDENIARAVAGNLAGLLATPDVAAAPVAGFEPAYRVTIDIQRFECVQGASTFVDAVWAVNATGASATRSGRTTAREVVRSADFDALAAAYSRALATVSVDIAAAVRDVAKNARLAPESPHAGAGQKR